MDMSIDIDDTERTRYEEWILSDWLDGKDYKWAEEYLKHPIKLCQVLSCRDVSVSKYRLSGNEEEDEDDDDDEDRIVISKKQSSTRMLKLILYDGKEQILAYEYEPIACLDVFNANCLTGIPVRCCGKIALFNSPVERNGALWLTQGNVKLVFEGYECHIESGGCSQPSPVIQSQASFTQEVRSPNIPGIGIGYNSGIDTPHSQHSTASHGGCVSHHKDSYEISQKRGSSDHLDVHLPVKRLNIQKTDESQKTPLESYFPKGSSYLIYSYISFLVRENEEAGEASFERFARTFIESRGYNTHGSIAKVLTSINQSPSFIKPEPAWFEDNLHFGFLDHAVPLIDVNCTEVREMTLLESTDMSVTDDGGLWFVKLDDCVASFFCLVMAGTLDIRHDTSLLELSRRINSVEGFFELKCKTIGEDTLYWISRYQRNLSDEEFLVRTKAIEKEFQHMENLLDF